MAELPKSLGILIDYYNEAKESVRIGDIVKGLPAPFPPPPPIIQDKWFKDETIDVDGYTFHRCRFDRCKLITEWATFNFENCFVSPDCVLYFQGPALKTVRLLTHHWRAANRIILRADEEGLAATINPDGTFTLK